MKTNEIIKRIDEYEEATETGLNIISKELICLLKTDLKAMAEKGSYFITKIEPKECLNYLEKEEDYAFEGIYNCLLLVFVDYYLKMCDKNEHREILAKVEEYFTFLLNKAQPFLSNFIFDFRSRGLNHADDYKYVLKYFNLLSNDNVLKRSSFIQDELYRQFCYSIAKICIKNEYYDYLEDFYKHNNRIMNPKVIIEYFMENQNVKKYDLNTLKFINSLFERLDIYIENINEQDIDAFTENRNIKQTGNIVLRLIEIFKTLKINKELFAEFDDWYREKNSIVLVNDFKTILESQYLNAIEVKTIGEYDNTDYKYNIFVEFNTNDGKYIIKKSVYPKISSNCLDFLELYIDFYTDRKQVIIEINEINEDTFNLELYELMNLYVNIKKYNNNIIIDSQDESIVKFYEKNNAELKETLDNFIINSMYLAEDLTSEEKRNKLKSFFNSAFITLKYNGRDYSCQNNYPYITNVKVSDVDYCVKAILKNSDLVNQIVSGEILIYPFEKMHEKQYQYAKGDYTNLVACHIKSVERYLKEVLIQYHKGYIYKTDKNKKKNQNKSNIEDKNKSNMEYNGWSIPDRIKPIDNKLTTAESLYQLECGGAIYALFYAYYKENNIGNFKVNSKFNKEWIQNVRNDHLHIDKIDTIEEALVRRSQTAFWLMHLINSLGTKGILIR